MDKYGWTKAGASEQARRAKVLLMLTERANREIWECIGLILTKIFKALSLSATHAFLHLVYPCATRGAFTSGGPKGTT
jgi:hypothetical protein